LASRSAATVITPERRTLAECLQRPARKPALAVVTSLTTCSNDGGSGVRVGAGAGLARESDVASVTVDERSAAIIAGIEAIQPGHVLVLPSSTLKAVVGHFLAAPGVHTFPVPREEEGVGILSGLVLAGQRAVMIIQDNGIGNLITALATFPQAYHIPMLIVTARRGGLGEYNSMIHTVSEHAEALLDAAQFRYFQLDGRTPLDAWTPTVVRAFEYARITHRPIFLLVNLMGG
jgi:sulfopyruvate decarboxylase subunit alpha